MSMTYPMPTPIEMLLGQIRAAAERLQGIVDGFVRVINWALDQLNRLIFRPIRWVADEIRQKWNEFLGVLEDVWEEISFILQNPGSPSTLTAAANTWISQVSNPLTTQGADLDASQDAVLQYWTGQGAEAYQTALGAQSDVLGGFDLPLRQVADALAATASTITDFYTQNAVALATLIGAMVGALAASGTIVGIPAGIVIAIGAALAYVAATTQIALIARQGAEDQARTFLDAQGSGDLPSEWPHVGSVSDDGSATDGDPSDWSTEPS